VLRTQVERTRVTFETEARDVRTSARPRTDRTVELPGA